MITICYCYALPGHVVGPHTYAKRGYALPAIQHILSVTFRCRESPQGRKQIYVHCAVISLYNPNTYKHIYALPQINAQINRICFRAALRTKRDSALLIGLMQRPNVHNIFCGNFSLVFLYSFPLSLKHKSLCEISFCAI